MKKLIAFLIGLIIISIIFNYPPQTDNLNHYSNIQAMLKDAVSVRLADSEFIETVMTFVPNINSLEKIRYSCWEYYLVLEDGTEYLVSTDNHGRVISISLWDSVNEIKGKTIYEIK